MKEMKVTWHDANRRPHPFVSVLGLLSEEKSFAYPRVREVFYVPKEERCDRFTPKSTDEDFFEPESGFWCPALRSFVDIVKWAAMPDPFEEDEDE